MGNYLQAIFLGFIQGLTEFLPISSSAHLRIAGELFDTPVDPGATFTAITQIGTEVAVLLYFRNDIMRIIVAVVRSLKERKLSQDARLGYFIALGSLPIIILGYLGQETIRSTFRSLWLIAAVLIIFGLILGELALSSATRCSALWPGAISGLGARCFPFWCHDCDGSTSRLRPCIGAAVFISIGATRCIWSRFI
ncbi:MAG: hypothetical protein RLZZ251_619 [Actinomycetota bacterium]